MTLQDFFQEFRKQAAMLPKKYEDYSIDYLADEYCKAIDNNDDVNRSTYLSALCLREWLMIGKMKAMSPGLDPSEYYYWLVDGIDRACKYRAWQSSEKKTTADACFKQAIYTARKTFHYNSNLDKNCANFNTRSMESPVIGKDGSESKTTVGDMIADTYVINDAEDIAVEDDNIATVKRYFRSGKIVEAIVMDTAATNIDAVRKTTARIVKTTDEDGKEIKYKKYSTKFYPNGLVRLLKALPKDYDRYFVETYGADPKQVNSALASIRTADSTKLHRYVNSTKKLLGVD